MTLPICYHGPRRLELDPVRAREKGLCRSKDGSCLNPHTSHFLYCTAVIVIGPVDHSNRKGGRRGKGSLRPQASLTAAASGNPARRPSALRVGSERI